VEFLANAGHLFAVERDLSLKFVDKVFEKDHVTSLSSLRKAAEIAEP
jgi:hypothetical protein